jgi:hypothetical protein
MKEQPKKPTISALEKAFAQLFYGKRLPEIMDEHLPDELPDDVQGVHYEDENNFPGFSVPERTDEDVEKMIAAPNSPYHKIKAGYWYSIYMDSTVNTGKGGAQLIYKELLKKGMEEEMIETIIFIHIDRNRKVPLSQIGWRKL